MSENNLFVIVSFIVIMQESSNANQACQVG